MTYTAVITVPGNPKVLMRCIREQHSRNDRGGYTVKTTPKGTTVTITSRDGVALRATLNSITKMLIIFERVQEVAHGRAK